MISHGIDHTVTCRHISSLNFLITKLCLVNVFAFLNPLNIELHFHLRGVVHKWRHTILDNFNPLPPLSRFIVLRLDCCNQKFFNPLPPRALKLWRHIWTTSIYLMQKVAEWPVWRHTLGVQGNLWQREMVKIKIIVTITHQIIGTQTLSQNTLKNTWRHLWATPKGITITNKVFPYWKE